VKLIVGLGNPGIEYQFTPHNLGFLTVDRLADRTKVNVSNRHCRAVNGRTRIGSEEVLLAKPETFMNLSGLSVAELVKKYEVNVTADLVVVHDELDLPFGTVRLKQRGGTAGHNDWRASWARSEPTSSRACEWESLLITRCAMALGTCWQSLRNRSTKRLTSCWMQRRTR